MSAECVCGNEIEDAYHNCEFRCHSNQTWWCDVCGSIAIGFDDEPPEPEDFNRPLEYC